MGRTSSSRRCGRRIGWPRLGTWPSIPSRSYSSWAAWPCWAPGHGGAFLRGGAAGRGERRPLALTAIVVCWLPVRAAILIAVYLHRVERFPYDWPLHAMNHFFSPWVGLLLLVRRRCWPGDWCDCRAIPRKRTPRRGRKSGGKRKRSGRSPGGGPPRRQSPWQWSGPPSWPRPPIGTPSAPARQAASKSSIAIRPGPRSGALTTRRSTARRGATTTAPPIIGSPNTTKCPICSNRTRSTTRRWPGATCWSSRFPRRATRGTRPRPSCGSSSRAADCC